MPGWRQDTAALLAGCDALACPSRHEPLGNVIVEAFAASRPVVAAAAAGPRELIQPGEDGLLVPLEDAEALATSLGLVLGDRVFASRPRPRRPGAVRGRVRRGARAGAMARVPRRGGQGLMCGIAGVTLEPGAPLPGPAVTAALTAALAHRGPDGEGHSTVGRTALVQTRLAIIDLQTGDQPLYSGPATLVANGEIYNYRELSPGMQLATGSDCEPPLHLWRQRGTAYAEPLRGMFAVAIHDRATRSLTLTRDRFGIKPLYTATIPGGLAFASEPQALLAAGLVGRAVRPAARDELLQMQFTTGADTVFPGIQRVLPGETLRVVDGLVVDRQRLRALPAGPPEDIGEEAALARLDAALERSVELHQRSDVPYGMFLSGGVDSAAVLALMARLNTAPRARLHRRVRRARRCGRTRPGRRGGGSGRRPARAADGHGSDDLVRAAPHRRRHGRPGCRLRHHTDLVPGAARAAGRQGRAVGRGGRRVVRRLRPISQRDAAVVAWRPRHAVARDVRWAGRVARGAAGLAGRHRGGGNACLHRGAAAACRWRRRPTWRTGCRTTCC